ncbi:MAG: MATE family efflux transporter [Lachnospiraceae bacterium]|nr:MATE family efflux transporter [Lachnospiraceae bacterium]
MIEKEMEQAIPENRMGTAPVATLMLKMAFPIILSTLVQSLYNIVDGMFVARISEEAMTAITYTQPIVIVLMAVGTGIAVGMNTMLSRALGEKNKKQVNDAAQTAIFLTFVAALISLMAAFIFVHPFMASQTNNVEIQNLGVKYLRIYLALGIGTIGQMVFERMLISTGKTIYSMISQITGAIFNLILDPILIFGLFGFPAMGISGAAFATVFSQIVAMLIAVVLNHKKNYEISMRFTLKPPVYAVKRILFLGVPPMVLMTLNGFMLLG